MYACICAVDGAHDDVITLGTGGFVAW